jgi:hypothetical protein
MESPPRLRQVNGNVMTPGPIANTNPFETPAASRTPAEVETPTGRTRVFRNAAFATELCEGVRFSWGPVQVRDVAAASVHVAAPHPSGPNLRPARHRPTTGAVSTHRSRLSTEDRSTPVCTRATGSPMRPEAVAQRQSAPAWREDTE